MNMQIQRFYLPLATFFLASLALLLTSCGFKEPQPRAFTADTGVDAAHGASRNSAPLGNDSLPTARRFVYPLTNVPSPAPADFVSTLEAFESTGFRLSQDFDTDLHDAATYCTYDEDLPPRGAPRAGCDGGRWMFGHDGIDVAANIGTPLYASGNGRVEDTRRTAADDGTGWGNYVWLRHRTPRGDRYTLYTHMNSVSVREGQTVNLGDRIGTVGTTGRSTGPHLHFTVTKRQVFGNGYYYDGDMPEFILDPVDFLANHAGGPGTSTPDAFEFHASPGQNPKLCSDKPTGGPDTDWKYSCSQSSRTFQAGQTVWGLLRIDRVTEDHRFKVVFKRSGTPEVTWAMKNWNRVGSGGWKYAYFWPKLPDAEPGRWMMETYVDVGEGFGSEPLSTTSFTVSGQSSPGTSSRGFHFDARGGSNPKTCADEPSGSESTGWVYTCDRPRSNFQAGEDVWALFRIDDVTTDHRFKIESYRDGHKERAWTSPWNRVGDQRWNHAFFWNDETNVAPGQWSFEFYVDTGDGFPATPTATTSFNVEPSTAYTYNGSATTCRGPVTGGEDTDWRYTCENPGSTFNAGETVWSLFRIDDVFEDHRIRVSVWRNGQHQWKYTNDWNRVDGSWDYAYFWPKVPNAQPGRWEIRVQIATETQDFRHLDTVKFWVR